MQLQVMPVRLDKPAKRLLVASSGAGEQIRSHVARSFQYFARFPSVQTPRGTQTGRSGAAQFPG